jgi:hypothetical protein
MVEIVHKETFTAIGTAIRAIERGHAGHYATPVWGRKNTENIKNLGFVIGYADPSRQQAYRVDYDDRKLLHINWEKDARGPRDEKVRLKECYLVRPHFRSAVDELYDYWRSTTLHHATELPEDIRALMGGRRVWRGSWWSFT